VREDGVTAAHDPATLQGRRVAHQTPDGLPGLVREQRLRTPAAIACQDPDRSLSYAELDGLSDQLAEDILRSTGGRRGPVALRMHRQVEVLVAFLGVLKAGCYYVPIATTEPASRVRAMLEVVQPLCCILSTGIAGLGVPAVPVPDRVPAGTSRPVPAVAPDQPIYAMFTSGSTGTPKAVLVGSAGVCNRLRWMAEAFPLTAADRWLQKTAYTFDVSGWEFYLPVITGGCCVFAPVDAHLDARAIARVIAEQRITICHFVPTMLEEYLRRGGGQHAHSLRMVFCSGEALPAGLAARFGQQLDAELHNLYGPTEASIEVTHWPVPRRLDPTGEVLIGAPIDNVDLRICDRDGQPLPAGSTGELWIGGVQVALGYLRQPELTARAFGDRDGQRWYRTGDLAQFVDGRVRYLGRVDDQVKIRGVRVEPGEIEAALIGHPAIGQAAVVPVHAIDGLELVAVAVPVAEPVPEPELLAYLGDRLPRAFVPRSVLWLESLPLTLSGKADRNQLGQYATAARVASAARIDQAEPAADPVAAHWWQALDIAPDEQLTDIGFLSLGGHSLSAVRLLATLLDRLGVDLPPSVLLRDNLSLSGLRSLIAGTEPVELVAPIAGDTGRSPLTPAQEPVWLVSQLLADPSGYNVVGTLRIGAVLDPDCLREALGDLLVRHDALRAGVEVEGGVPAWRYADRVELPADLVTSRTGSDLDGQLIEDFVAEIAGGILDPARAPLLRAGLLRTGTESVLTLSLHHLIADLRTLEVLVEELALAYAARAAGVAPSWPAPAASFAGFAQQRAATVGGPAWQQDLTYWQELLRDAPSRTSLPFGLAAPAEPTLAGRRFVAELDQKTSQAIDDFLAEHGYTSATYFLACISSVLAAWSGEAAITVGMPVSQRQRAAQLDLVGFLLTTVPLRLEVAEHPDRDGLLSHVRDRYVNALEHATPTVQAIAHRLGLPPTASANPLFQVWVNDLSRTAPAPDFGAAPAEWVTIGRPAALFDLNYYLRRSGGYQLELICGAGRYPDPVAEQLLAQVVALAAALLEPAPGQLECSVPAAAPSIPTASLVTAVRQAAAANPGAVAIRSGEDDVSYRELLEAIDRTAGQLATAGIGPDDLVELRAERSPGLPAALLAAWQLGAAVAITDPGQPATVLAEQTELLRPLAILTLDRRGLVDIQAGRPDPRRLAGISHLLFTSGSSGRPAAVTVPPQALAAGLRWYQEEFSLGPADRVILLGGIGHDPSLRELLATLIAGGTLIVPPAGIFASPDRLFELLDRQRVSVLNTTPALLELIRSGRPAGARLDRLRLVVSGGASLTAGLARAIRTITPARLVNGYGSTETPQLASCYQVAGHAEPVADGWPDDAGLPVGAGVNGARLSVRPIGAAVDQELPVGQVGEVVVDSPYLATGYLTGTDRTGFDPTGTRYRTGDRGRLHPSGLVVLDGRLDRQLSLDGHRIDPEQIERAALRHPAVRRALARLRDSPAGELLTLSVIASEDQPVPTVAELRAELRRQLPRYAVPTEIELVPAFVLNRNHKVSQPGPAEVTAAEQPGRVSELPSRVTELTGWVAELIGIELPPTENYFDAGLNSMAVVRLHAGLTERLGRGFPITAMFQYPNLTALARFLDGTHRLRPPDRRPSAQPIADRAVRRRQLRQQLRHDFGGIDDRA
jgi:amino acid adenylation domain-containing protein